ncbi:Broad specificity phosphatase PhoE [Paenibacillus sp. 1_12]|uniref:histidine phosphatase family protein n=1 Tax=Paenibacillus sp. 1_12 TaxID=1566278 RepID=UPI0008E37FB9|nr:histidine phosphatase family protein [Paenibacillus sp. 1_12]SFL84319.1 Broad specificity phosphatase PhoE [Paenibacillus sp. 1_12]
MLAQALLIKDGSVLMLNEYVERGDLVWNFPGGGIEQGESPEQACIREVKEETGYDVRITHLLNRSESKYTFLVEIVGGQLAIDVQHPDNQTIVSAEWVPLSDENRWDRVTRPIWEAYNKLKDALKTIYVIRHAQAEGQAAEAFLTSEGMKQSEQLGRMLSIIHIDEFRSSPMLRAQQTLKSVAMRTGQGVVIDNRLSERVLSSESMANWRNHLERTFSDKLLCYPGGESSHSASQRVVSVMEELLASDGHTFAVVTHGNLMALLLGYYKEQSGFEDWSRLTNPDVYRLTFIRSSLLSMERIWDTDKHF